MFMRLGNVDLANAVIEVLNGRETKPWLLPLKAVPMRIELNLNQSSDHPGLIRGQARVNYQVWNLADQALS